jgi:phosphatidylinositol alpha-mannosyltransferase
MRVALVCGYDWAVPGGARNQVAAIARALAGRGEEVAVIAPGGPERPPDRAGMPGEPFRRFRTGRTYGVPANGSIAPVAPTPVAAYETRRSLSEFAPDVVHVHEPLVPGPPLAAVFFARAPVVATFHRAGVDPVYRLEARLLGAAVARRVRVATAVSQAATATARSVLGTHLEKVVEVGNGVEVARFEQARARWAEESAAVSGPYKNGARPVVAFVGRHEPRKGAALLIDAARSLPDDGEFLVAGHGPETTMLRARAASDDRVRLVGQLDDDEVARMVAGADVLVAPSVSGESFGVIILEAMAAGTCVVTSDLPAYRLAAGRAAVHFRAGDVADLARTLSEVLHDQDLREELVARGLERAARCSIEVVTSAYLECYRQALAPA